MLSLDPRSVGERLAAAKDENQLKSAVIGALMMKMGVTKLDIDLSPWIDAPDCMLATGHSRFSPMVSLEIEPVQGDAERPQPPGWVDEMRLDFDGLGR